MFVAVGFVYVWGLVVVGLGVVVSWPEVVDQRIEIHGTSRMNGKRGVATDFHPALTADFGVIPEQSRYSVHLDSGETYKFRPTAVRAERVAATGSARPKGKGKKGRG